jgi:hypothetical protein
MLGNMYEENFQVTCNTCKCKGPRFRTENEAIKLWNTRSTNPPTAEWEYTGNLLAVVHCDGGHYTAEHGVKKSTDDAIEIVCEMKNKLAGAPPTAEQIHKAAVWQLIETAPRDKNILGWGKQVGFNICYWNELKTQWSKCELSASFQLGDKAITHWLPLSEPLE